MLGAEDRNLVGVFVVADDGGDDGNDESSRANVDGAGDDSGGAEVTGA
jgi:hypothetical protein